MKYGCTFYLEKEQNEFSPINVCITFAGTRLRYFIGYRINKDNFPIRDKEGKIIKYEVVKNANGKVGTTKVKYNEINNRISEIETFLHDYFTPLKATPDKKELIEKLDFLCSKVKNEKTNLETFWDTVERYKQDAEVSDLNRKQIKSVFNHFKSFEEFHFKASTVKVFTFDTITGETIGAFEKWLKDGTRGRNYLATVLKKFQRFFNWAIQDQKQKGIEITIKNPFVDYEITPELYGTPIVMTKEERDLLFDFAIENDRLSTVRDIFMFQCYCGARISDLLKFTKNNFQNGELKYIPQKTSKDSMKTVEVPLNSKAIAILKRYNEPDGYLLPRFTDVEINRTLKHLFELVGLNRPVEYLNPLTQKTEFKPLHELATTHLARRTFTGLLYNNEVKDDVIASMTGHSEKSTAFKRYRKIEKELQKKATLNL
jgi:integrase